MATGNTGHIASAGDNRHGVRAGMPDSWIRQRGRLMIRLRCLNYLIQQPNVKLHAELQNHGTPAASDRTGPIEPMLAFRPEILPGRSQSLKV
jgi:hypothetical protein